jgi:glycerol-3-phosphate acyltransferase PlsY
LLLVAAYLLGAIPTAQLVAARRGIDLRQVHTTNVGAGNLSRHMGMRWGLLVALADVSKSFLPVTAANLLGFGPGAAGMVGVGAVVGHNWSIFMRGRSGRGLAPSAGLVLAIDPALLLWVMGWAISGWWMRGGIAGFMGWGLLPVVAVTLGRPSTETVMIVVLSAVLMIRRAQGNVDSEGGFGPTMERIFFDLDKVVDEIPLTIDEPLTP